MLSGNSLDWNADILYVIFSFFTPDEVGIKALEKKQALKDMGIRDAGLSDAEKQKIIDVRKQLQNRSAFAGTSRLFRSSTRHDHLLDTLQSHIQNGNLLEIKFLFWCLAEKEIFKNKPEAFHLFLVDLLSQPRKVSSYSGRLFTPI